MKAICYNLAKAGESGTHSDTHVLKDRLQSVSRNLNVHGPSGKRYKTSVQQFYEVLLIWGGRRLLSFVSANLYGPHQHTVVV